MITCHEASEIAHGSRDNVIAVYGSVITYTCNYGYRFPSNDNTEWPIECLHTRFWNDTVEDCEGMR